MLLGNVPAAPKQRNHEKRATKASGNHDHGNRGQREDQPQEFRQSLPFIGIEIGARSRAENVGAIYKSPPDYAQEQGELRKTSEDNERKIASESASNEPSQIVAFTDNPVG